MVRIYYPRGQNPELNFKHLILLLSVKVNVYVVFMIKWKAKEQAKLPTIVKLQANLKLVISS